MDKRILKALLLCVLLDAGPFVVSGGWFCSNPSPPVCADDCNGNGYYLNEDETECIQCPQCPPGQELNKACGNGLNGDAVCIPCPEGFFSSSTSKQCTPCTTCINTVERESCQVTQDRVCGDCLQGFVRRSGRFSTDQNACPDICSDLPRDDPRCSDWWNNQQEGPVEEKLPLKPAPTEQSVEVVPLDWPDTCEPEPPQCIDHCHDGNYYLDYDGMCKACLQCQPGEELNKVCGRGNNGDGYCQRCPEGTFSVDGLGRCTPCRICVNTVATECTSTRDSECGECLPGYYQEADGFFPDRGACPNKCMECPTNIPQCQEWCESEVSIAAAESIGQDAVSHPAVEADVIQLDVDKEKINVEAGSPSASHASYTVIFTVLASLLIVIFIILVVIIFVFHHLWRKPGGSSASITAESRLLSVPSATSTPGSSPGSTPSTANRLTCPVPSAENALDLETTRILGNPTSPRPSSGSSTDGEDWSSEASTPIMKLNRRLANMDLWRHTLERQVGHEDSSKYVPQHHFLPYWSAEKELMHAIPNHVGHVYVTDNHPTQSAALRQSDRDPRPNAKQIYAEGIISPRLLSSGKVVTEKESGTVHPHLEDQDVAPGRLVRRRHSIISNDQLRLPPSDPLPRSNRRNSLPGLQPGSVSNGNKKSSKGSNGNIAHEQEPEAALFPPDSTGDDGSAIVFPADTNNNESVDPRNLGRSLKSTAPKYTASAETAYTKPIGINGTLPILPEKSSTETTPRKPLPRDTGNKSPSGETNVTINISMISKCIDNIHVGDTHNSLNFSHKTEMASEPQGENGDQDEAEKLLNINTTEADAFPVDDGCNNLSCDHNGDNDHDDIGEEDKLLDLKSS